MSDGDEDDEEDEYDDDSGSDAEEEGAGGEEGGKGGSDGGGRGGGERGGEGDGNTTGGEGCEGGAAGGGVGKKGKSQALTSGYDYFDEWIDDAGEGSRLEGSRGRELLCWAPVLWPAPGKEGGCRPLLSLLRTPSFHTLVLFLPHSSSHPCLPLFALPARVC
jgi:hypothetical protein